ncbi:MAG: hypothetical protein JSU67_11755 [Gammaproteobacteria bacterium]|nr:MAG: hypothetical protein JSU67_11755 [Gammaproteobacteria bacterium]
MLKTRLLAFMTAALLSLGAASQANQAEVQPEAETNNQAQAAVPNFFDPNYWINSFTGTPAPVSTELTFNAAHPASWMKWVDPKTHTSMHMHFMNPASYAQFMQPQFYMEFMKPENMAAWMDFNQYAVMMDPQTMSYWMNPGSYMHMADPNMYTAAMNPANYMVYMNPATYAGWTGAQTCDPNNPNSTQTWFGYTC